MSVKSSTSYAQEDLDLINSEILNLEQSISPLISEGRAQKSDTPKETCSSEPALLADSLNELDSTESVDNEYKNLNIKEKDSIKEEVPVKQEANEASEVQVNTMAVQLGIVESDMAMKHIQKNLIIKEELKNVKMEDEKVFEKSDELKPKILNRGGLKFFPGAKLEAKDFNEKW